MKRAVVLILMLLSALLASCAMGMPDQLDVKEIKNCQFVIFKAKDDDYLEADNSFIDAYLSKEDADVLGLSTGEFAIVTADVTRYEGGIFGYKGNKSIDKLISYEIIDVYDASARCGIPEMSAEGFTNEHRMLMYHSNENAYYVLSYKSSYLVYLNEDFIIEYEKPLEPEKLMALIDGLSEQNSEQDDNSVSEIRSEE